MSERAPDFDVIIIGGGPAGSTLGSLLGRAGSRTLIVEKDIHPREHVGEALTPSTNVIFDRIGVLEKMEEAGFVRKPGVAWTTPAAPVGTFPVAIWTAEFPFPGSPRPYSFNVERDALDAILLRHAHESGARVLQGVQVRRVLFEGDRAVGVRARALDGWERDFSARVVVDASGRRCLLADQLGLRRKDPEFNQFGIYSWFRGVEQPAAELDGFLFLHFLGLERAWAWQIPLRNGIWSVGVVTDKGDFQKSGKSDEEFFESLVTRNRNLAHVMRGAERIRPWFIEGDYTYKNETVSGPGWLLIGDALRFVDPIFSTGVDVATYSASHAFDAIQQVLRGADEELEFKRFERRVQDGVDAWYELTALFYKLQNLFTIFAVRKRFRERVVRVLQGNLYVPEYLQRARDLIEVMKESYEKIMRDPHNLLRPGALAERRSSLQRAP